MKKMKKLAASVRSTSVREKLTAVQNESLVKALGYASGKDASGPGSLACGHYEYDCPA